MTEMTLKQGLNIICYWLALAFIIRFGLNLTDLPALVLSAVFVYFIMIQYPQIKNAREQRESNGKQT